DDDREEDSVVSADKVTTRPVAPPPKPPPVQHRTAASASKAPPGEPHPRNDDSEVQSVALAAEMRRRSIRLKYGINEKDQEFYRRKGEDQEEFEKVNVVAHPAHTKMRKAKLKWKEKEKSGSDVDVSKTEKSVAEGLDVRKRIPPRGQEARYDICSQEATLTELRILIIRIEELELANRKLRLQMRRMKKKLAEKEKVAQPPIKRAPTPPPMSKPSKPATRPPPPPPTASKPPPPPPAPKKPAVVQPAVDNKKVVRQKPSQAVKQPTRQRPSTK
ncbi:unnamed protein product, partial [Nippostrongylus brasiliensis]|uniref:Transcriptional regulator icp4 n=1 Tax=Nippostrongylus brasiliensis TaxID=27835 RepID=A0A0N4YN52_NIPBR